MNRHQMQIDYPSLGQSDFSEGWLKHPEAITKIQRGLWALKRLLEAEDHSTVLDVGCFRGYAFNWLERYCKADFDYTGIDMNQAAIEYAREINPDVTYEVRDLFSLIDTDQKYDIVFCARVLIHLEDWEDAIKAIIHAARKYVVLVVRLEGRDYTKEIEGVNHRSFTIATLDEAVEKLGYQITLDGQPNKYQPIIIPVEK